MPLFGMDTQQQVVNRFVCSCSSWYDLRGRGKCNKYRLKILNIRCRAMIGSVHWRVKGLNNLVYWYQYNTLLAWCKPMEEFGDIPRYWESNTFRICSTKGNRNELDPFSIDWDTTSASCKTVAVRVTTLYNSEAFGDIKLLVIPYEYLVGNIAKVSS